MIIAIIAVLAVAVVLVLNPALRAAARKGLAGDSPQGPQKDYIDLLSVCDILAIGLPTYKEGIMGNPTYGGLVRIQSLFEGSQFPLPDFRVGIDKGPKPLYGCGLPMEHYFTKGEPSDLSLRADESAHEEVDGVALCCLEGGYGLRFIREVFQQACPLNVDLSLPVRASGVSVTMEAYGDPDFVGYVYLHYNKLRDVGRYGVSDPSFLDRVKMSIVPWWYAFPEAA